MLSDYMLICLYAYMLNYMLICLVNEYISIPARGIGLPKTLARTTLGSLQAGDSVNLEADCLAKMVGALLERRGLIGPPSGATDS